MRFFVFLMFFSLSLFANNKPKILIPLYSTPEYWLTQVDKFQQIKDKGLEVYAIINPDNGPGKFISEEYINGIKFLKEYNIHVIGYVHTLYGKREPYEVKEDIYRWSDFYQFYGVEGIFFDETDSKLISLEFYQDLTKYAKTQDFNFNILNPGYTTDNSYIEKNIAELIVSYENSAKAFNEEFPKDTNKQSENTKLSILLHSMQESDFTKILEVVKTKDFDFIYFTEDRNENPWDTISQHLLNIL